MRLLAVEQMLADGLTDLADLLHAAGHAAGRLDAERRHARGWRERLASAPRPRCGRDHQRRPRASWRKRRDRDGRPVTGVSPRRERPGARKLARGFRPGDGATAWTIPSSTCTSARDGELVVTHDAVVRPCRRGALPRLERTCSRWSAAQDGHLRRAERRTAPARRWARCSARSTARDLRLIAGSFDLELVAEVRAAAPHVPRSILFASRLARCRPMIDACRELGAAYAHPCFRPIERAMIDAFTPPVCAS